MHTRDEKHILYCITGEQRTGPEGTILSRRVGDWAGGRSHFVAARTLTSESREMCDRSLNECNVALQQRVRVNGFETEPRINDLCSSP